MAQEEKARASKPLEGGAGCPPQFDPEQSPVHFSWGAPMEMKHEGRIDADAESETRHSTQQTQKEHPDLMAWFAGVLPSVECWWLFRPFRVSIADAGLFLCLDWAIRVSGHPEEIYDGRERTSNDDGDDFRLMEVWWTSHLP